MSTPLLSDAERIGQALDILVSQELLPHGGTCTVDSVVRTIGANTTGLVLEKRSGRQPYPLLADILDLIAPVDQRYRRTNNDIYRRLRDARWAGRPLVPSPEAIKADLLERKRLRQEWEATLPPAPDDGRALILMPQQRAPCDPPVLPIGEPQ